MIKALELHFMAFILFGAILGGGFFLFSREGSGGKQELIQSMNVENDMMKKQIEKINKQITEAKSSQELIKSGYSLDKVKEFFPDNYSSTQLISLLTKQAQESKISVISSEHNQFKEHPGEFEGVSARLEFHLTYSELVLFLSRLTAVDKIILIRDYEMSYLKDKKDLGLIKFVATFDAYYDHQNILRAGSQDVDKKEEKTKGK